MSGQRAGSERFDELAGAISAVEPPRARDEFRHLLRQRLIAAAHEELLPERKPRGWFPAVPRFALAAVLMAAVIGGSGGFAAASSLPGDPAFGLKLALEQVELALAFDETQHLSVLTQQADRRLDELARTTVTRPQQVPTATATYEKKVEEFRQAVDSLRTAEPDDRRMDALNVAEAAFAKHVAVLEELRDRHETPGLDRALDEQLERTKDVKQKVHERVEEQNRRGPDRRTGTVPPTTRPTPTPRPSRPAETQTPRR